jgi:hypothetical protein
MKTRNPMDRQAKYTLVTHPVFRSMRSATQSATLDVTEEIFANQPPQLSEGSRRDVLVSKTGIVNNHGKKVQTLGYKLMMSQTTMPTEMVNF